MPPSSDEICATPEKRAQHSSPVNNRYSSSQQTTTLDKIMQRYYERQHTTGVCANPGIRSPSSYPSQPETSSGTLVSMDKGQNDITSSSTRTAPPGEQRENTNENKNEPDNRTEPATGVDYLRKAGVAVAGGSLVGIGAILVPLPIPAGFLTMGAGMAVLGTEFPEARRVLDGAVDKVAEVLEPTEDRRDDANDKESSNAPKSGLEEATYVLKKQAERLGQHVLPLIRPESSTIKQPKDVIVGGTVQ